MPETAYVYILASKRNGTLYTGVTSNLEKRMIEHKSKTHMGFTVKYNIDRLVWFTSGSSIRAAIELERKIKNCGRKWKIDLIEKTNPNWLDLSNEILDSATSRRMFSKLSEVARKSRR